MEGLEILSAIPEPENKKRAWDAIKTHFSELVMDTDQHPVVFDEQGVLRFKEDPLLSALQQSGVLDLNKLFVAVARNQLTQEQQRKVTKSCGYSLAGYFELTFVEEWCKEINSEEDDADDRPNKKTRTE